jgi:multidrug resistance protein MdtO
MTFLQMLGSELAPTPGRARATARIVVACLVTTTVVMALHLEHGSFAIITIFIVSQANTGATLQKAVLRLAGTTLGGSVGIVAYILFADRPWLRVALIGPLAAFFIFLSNTTTAPYLGVLGAVTVVLVMTVPETNPEAGVYVGLWRFAMVALGVAITTAAQMLLWPDDPEDQLLEALGERLTAIEGLVSSLHDGRPVDSGPLDALMLTGFSRQLDLLDNIAARYPALRLRHAEQVALIAGLEQLLTAAVGLAHATSRHQAATSAPVRDRLAAVGAACARLRHAFETRQPMASSPSPHPLASDAEVAAAGGAPLLPALVEMERAVATLPETTGFLDRTQPMGPIPTPRSPLDVPSDSPFFTPAFSLTNTEAIGVALRTGLCANLSYLLYEGAAWSGLSTAVITCIVVSQSSLGASTRKSLLRIAGATFGGLLGLFTIAIAMPNMDRLPSLLVVVAAGMGLAAWIFTGSARISYAGLQTGLAFAVSALNDLGATTDLAPPRDRVVGILLGIVVTDVVHRLAGPVLAGAEMRRALANTLRSLALLSRVGLHGDAGPHTVAPARGWRWKVYQDLTTTLRLHDESKFEWGVGRPDAEAERVRVARLAANAQAVFMALLAAVRHRLDVTLQVAAMPAAAHQPLRALGPAVTGVLEALGDRIDGKATPSAPPLAPVLARAREAVDEAEAGLDPRVHAHWRGRIAVYEDLVAQVVELERVAETPAVDAPSPSRG